MAQPAANCAGNGEEGYTCTVVANGQPVSLPFDVTSGEGDTAYVVYCAFGTYYVEDSTCVDSNTADFAYVVAFTNAPDTIVAAYANTELFTSSSTFYGTNGFSIDAIIPGDSTCDVYGEDYCPGIQEANGDAYFYSGDNEIIIVPYAAVNVTPTTNPCNAGVYCDTAAIAWTAPAGTVITIISTGDSPNITFTIPASGTYTSLNVDDTTYSYTTTVPGGSPMGGTVTTPAAYDTVTVTVT